MACVPLNIQTGLFVPQSWNSAPNTAFNGGTVTLDTAGPNPGISVQKSAVHDFHAQLANHSLHYMVLGNEFVLILDVEASAAGGDRRVNVVDLATGNETNVITVSAASTVPLPVVQASPGNASVFLAYGIDGTQQTAVGIYRSRDGALLCSLGSIVATGQTEGEATTTSLIIHYSVGGASQTQVCPKPTGTCTVSPASQSFPTVFVGGCPAPAPTRQFTIRNTGSDCLTVNAIGNAGPFTVQSTSVPLPAVLGISETLIVTVEFNPGASGNYPSVSLPITTTPTNGANHLACSGSAGPAEFHIGFSTLERDFGSVPVGTTRSLQFTIVNTGSKPLPVSVPPLDAAGFHCPGWNGTLNCTESHAIAVDFAPTVEGPAHALLPVTTSAAPSPQNISLDGVGCVPNALIVVPPVTPIDFGQIQHGFRTVRLLEIDNAGDGPLTFNATISGPNASLFGLPDPNGSVTVTPANQTYTVASAAPCGGGPGGSGKVQVAISFYASAAPGMFTASLTLSGQNATNFPASQTWNFPLTAEITPPVALDVASVVDHSYSMTQPLGSRVKMDVAVAAGQLLVQLLRPDENDRVSLVRFNELPEVIDAITPVSSTATPTQAAILADVANRLPPPAGSTAIAAGALTGVAQVQTPRPGPSPAALTQAVIVLTDGVENTGYHDPASGNWFSLLGGQIAEPPAPGTTSSPGSVNSVPMPRPAGIKIYAVGIGRDGEVAPDQLNALAGDPGNVFRVNQDLTGTAYFQLEKYYTQIFMDIVGTSPVVDPMFWISNGQTQEIEFDVLRGDVDALVVIYDWQGMRLPFHCVSPTGEVIDPAAVPAGYQLRTGVTYETRFLEFKTPVGQPERYAGRWKVVIEHPGRVCFGAPSRKTRGFVSQECRRYLQPVLYGVAIGVGSNLRMTPYVTPGPVYVGDPILLAATVNEAGLPITSAQVTVQVTAPNGTVEQLTLADDGHNQDGDADDGEYARSYIHTYQEGTYHFLFRTVGRSRDGEPVAREAARDKNVLTHDPIRPNDGGKDSTAGDCCEELIRGMEKQTALLRELLDRQT